MKCPKCKIDNPDDSQFCRKCATALTKIPATFTSPPPEKEEVPEKLALDFTPGQYFGKRYQIIEEIGSGGMGRVYKALDKELNRTVALKMIKPEISSHPGIVERFKKEIKLASQITHENVCRIHDLGEVKGIKYISMQFIEGNNLHELIQTSKILRVETAINITEQICQALTAAHKKGVIHRDLKPQNIMIDKRGKAYVMDFGIARSLEAEEVTKPGGVIGTPHYMSPEQGEGKGADTRSDIYSLGCILYEMLTGKPPFKADTSVALIHKHLKEAPKPPSMLNPQVSPALEKIILKCLEKEPEKRYQGADEIIKVMDGAKPEFMLAEKPAKIRWKLYIPIAAIILIGLAIGFYFIMKKEKPETERISARERREMIAVLPFENLGAPENEYFADGITDEIIARLASIASLGVISRTSAIQYKNTDKSIKEIGEELGVDYILEGTVRWQRSLEGSSRIRVTPQLINVSDGTHLWADIYEKEMVDIFQVQSDIAERVAQALGIVLLEPERRYLEAVPTDNLEAYHYYLRGNDYYNRSSMEQDLTIAIQMYKKAVKLDPTFALAYTQLSMAHTSFYWYYYDRTEERLNKGKEAAEKALELDRNLPEAHLAMGKYYYHGKLEYDHALEEFAIVQKTRPNNSYLLEYIGYVKRRQGKFEEALAYQKRASELDPRSSRTASNLGGIYYLIRDYLNAERCYNMAISITPDWPRRYVRKAWLYLSWEGDTEKARQSLEMAPEKISEPGYVVPTWILLDVFDGNYKKALERLSSVSLEAFGTQFYFIPKAQLYAQIYGLMNQEQLEKEYYDFARKIMEAKVQERPEDERFHSALGIAYAGLGRKQEAILEAEKAVELLPVHKEAYRGTFRVEDLARVYIMVGEYDAAVDQLEFLLSIPGRLSIPWLRVDPMYEPLREHPRFQRLLEGKK